MMVLIEPYNSCNKISFKKTLLPFVEQWADLTMMFSVLFAPCCLVFEDACLVQISLGRSVPVLALVAACSCLALHGTTAPPLSLEPVTDQTHPVCSTLRGTVAAGLLNLATSTIMTAYGRTHIFIFQIK